MEVDDPAVEFPTITVAFLCMSNNAMIKLDFQWKKSICVAHYRAFFFFTFQGLLF